MVEYTQRDKHVAFDRFRNEAQVTRWPFQNRPASPVHDSHNPETDEYVAANLLGRNLDPFADPGEFNLRQGVG